MEFTAWATFRPGSRLRSTVRGVIVRLMVWLRDRPKLFALALRALRFFPHIERRILAIAHARGLGLGYNFSPSGETWQLDVEREFYENWKSFLQ